MFNLKLKKVKYVTQAHKLMKLLASCITSSNLPLLEHVLMGCILTHSLLTLAKTEIIYRTRLVCFFTSLPKTIYVL